MRDINDWLDEEDRRGEAHPRPNPALTAPDLNPDDVGTQRRMADAAGLPLDQAMAVPSIARAAEAARLEALRTTSPRLHAWVSEPQNHAIARDDVENLSWWERTFGRAAGDRLMREAGGQAAYLGRLDADIRDPLELSRQWAAGGRDTERGILETRQRGGRGQVWGDTAFGFSGPEGARGGPLNAREQARLAWLHAHPDAQPSFGNIPGFVARTLPQQIRSFELATQRGIRAMETGDIETDDSADSLNQNLLAYPAWRFVQGFFGSTFEQEAGQSYGSQVQQGIDPDIAARRAGQYGQIAAGIEFGATAAGLKLMGVDRLATRLAVGEALLQGGFRPVAGRAALAVLGGASAEGIEEGAQQLAQLIHEDLARQENSGAGADIGEAWRNALSPEGIAQILESTAYGFQAGLGFGAIPGGANFALDLHAMERAGVNATLFEQAALQAQSARTGERHGPTFEGAVNAMTGDAQVFVDADEFVDHFQQAGVNPFKAALEVGVSEDALAQAMQSHGRIAISTGAFANKILRDPAHTSLAEHAAFAPQDDTPAQARASKEKLREDFANTAREMLDQSKEASALFTQARDWMREKIAGTREQGAMAGMEGADLMGALFKTTVERYREAVARGEVPSSALDRIKQDFGDFLENKLSMTGPDVGVGVRGQSQGDAEQRDGPPARSELWRPPEGVRLTERERKIAEMAVNGAGNGWIADETEVTPLTVAVTLNGVSKKLRDAGHAVPWEPMPHGGRPGRRGAIGGGVMDAPTIEEIIAMRDGFVKEGYNVRADGVYDAMATRLSAKYGYDIKAQTIAVRISKHNKKLAQEAAARAAEAKPHDLTTEQGRQAWFEEEGNVISAPIVGEAPDARMYGFRITDKDTVVVTIAPEPGGAATVDWTFAARLKDKSKSLFGKGEEGFSRSENIRLMRQVLAVMEADVAHFKRDAYVFTPNDDSLAEIYRGLIKKSGANVLYSAVEDGAGATYLVRSGAMVLRNGTVKPSPENANAEPIRWESRSQDEVDAGQAEYLASLDGLKPLRAPSETAGTVRDGRPDAAGGSASGRAGDTATGGTGGSRRRGGDGSLTDAFQGDPVEAGQPGDPLSGDNAPRGLTRTNFEAFRGGRFDRALIALGKAANLSTALHEMFHITHLVFESIATDPQAPQEYRQMWQTTLDWWGLTQEQWDAFDTVSASELSPEALDALKADYRATYGRDIDPGVIDDYYRQLLKAPYFEQFAETGEVWLSTGKAPSLALHSVFQTFMRWMQNAYHFITGQLRNAKLTPEIRDVFERLFATEREIAEARAVMGADFTLAREQFKSDEEYAAYQDANRAAREAMEEQVRTRAMESVFRAGKRAWRKMREGYRAQAIEKIDNDPARQAERVLRGDMTAAPEDAPPMRLDPAALAEQWPGVKLPIALDPRTDAEAVIAEAMRIKRAGKDKQATRLWARVKQLGGINLDALPEADRARIVEAMGGARKRPGVINTKTGLSPEAMMAALTADGYFGEAAARAARGSDAFQGGSLFGSAALRAVETLRVGKGALSPTDAMPGRDWWNAISRAPGVKKQELEWIGLEEWLKAQPAPVSREEVASFIRANGVQVEETLLGETGADPELQRRLLPLIEERERLERSLDAYVQMGAANLSEAQRAEIGQARSRIIELSEEINPLQQQIADASRASSTKWSQFQLPGGTGYKELLLRLPTRDAFDPSKVTIERRRRSTTQGTLTVSYDGKKVGDFDLFDGGADGSHTERSDEEAIATARQYWENGNRYAGVKPMDKANFRSSHFPEPNILAHVRFNERTDVNGKRTLFLEEVQSDWHQAGRERGYKASTLPDGWTVREPGDQPRAGTDFVVFSDKGEMAATGATRDEAIATAVEQLNAVQRVPDAPFKNNAWAALAIKRMIRYAAENGFDQIAWTRGQHQIDRFSLARHVDELTLRTDASGRQYVYGSKNGNNAAGPIDVTESQPLESIVGVEMAQRLRDAKPQKAGEASLQKIGGLEGFEVGGNGMRAFYDRILPNIANDLGKKYGARVGETTISLKVPDVLTGKRGELFKRFDQEQQHIEQLEAIESPSRAEERELQNLLERHGETADEIVADMGLSSRLEAGEAFERLWVRRPHDLGDSESVHSLPLTPAMREGVLQRAPGISDAFAAGDNPKPPDLAEFIDTLVADLRGDRQVYSAKDEGALKGAQELSDARAWFEENGIDLSAKKEDIRAAVIAALEANKNEANSYHPDDIAPWFGFSSGDEMMQALAKLKPRAVAIEEEIDTLAKAELGDPVRDGRLEQEAKDAAHSEVQARKIEIELAAFETATGGRKSALNAHAKRYAQDEIEASSVKEIRAPEIFLAGERRAAKQAFEAAKKGDWNAAALAKSRQLMSFWLYHFARKADERLISIMNRWKEYSSNPTTRAAIGTSNIEQIDAILDAIETGKPSYRTSQSLSEWAKDIQDNEGVQPEELVFNPEVIEATIKRRLSEMEYGDVMAIDDALRNIEQIGRGAIKRRKAGEAARIADIREGLKERLRQEWSKAISAVRSLVAPDNIDKIKRDAASFHAVQLKGDFIARHLDGFKDGGPFMQLFGADVQHAENERHTRTQAASKQFLDIVRAHYSPKEFEALLSQRFFVPILNDNRTKAQLIGYALNRGVRYNFEALLRGEGWNVAVFNEVTSKLTRKDWTFVQALWNYVGQWKEERFALEERTRGVRPVEELAEPFTTADGHTYSGGYWPIAFDPSRSDRAAERSARSEVLAEHGARFRQPSTKRGSMIARVGTGGQALSSDFMAVLSSHVQETVNDLAYREIVITLRRTLADKELRSMIKSVIGERSLRALNEWAARLGQDVNPSAFGDFGALLPYLRRSYSAYAMGWKASVAILNLLGHMQAIPRNGVLAQLKQASITLGPGFADLLRRHAVAMISGKPAETAARVAFVTERSPMVAAHLQGHFDREIIDAKDDFLGRRRGTIAPKMLADLFQYFNIYTNQIVVVPTWTAAYENAINGSVKGVPSDNEAKAIDHADNVVRMTVSAGSAKDMAAITASRNEWVRISTMFMNWANIAYNQFFSEQAPGVASGKIPAAKFAANMLWIWAAPAVLSMMLRGQLDKEDNEDDWEYWRRIGLSIASFPLATAWLVRDIANNLIAGMPKRTPGDTVVQRLKTIESAAERGDTDRLIKQGILLGAQVTGVPQAAVTAGDYAVDFAQGNEKPLEDPGDAFSEALLRDTR